MVTCVIITDLVSVGCSVFVFNFFVVVRFKLNFLQR